MVNRMGIGVTLKLRVAFCQQSGQLVCGNSLAAGMETSWSGPTLTPALRPRLRYAEGEMCSPYEVNMEMWTSLLMLSVMKDAGKTYERVWDEIEEGRAEALQTKKWAL